MTLSHCARGRDNNFNLIRVIAAFAVLVAHSFALCGRPEPVASPFGMSLGEIAVDLFFVTSGFLVTSSILGCENLMKYVWARVLRIYPALWVVLLLSVFGLGVSFSKLSLPSYLIAFRTYTYLLRCGSLITGVSYNLPGVFLQNPFPGSMNGSLWTMPDEVRLYIIIGIIWYISQRTLDVRFYNFKCLVVSGFVLVGACMITLQFQSPNFLLSIRHYYMFFFGAIYSLFKDKVQLSHKLFLIAAIGLCVASFNVYLFYLAYVAVLPYVLFYAAYIPAGMIRRYNRLGDYSYGIYIYAFPIQQSTVALVPNISPVRMMLIAAPITITFAILSWYFVERRALNLKAHIMQYRNRILSYDDAQSVPMRTR